MKYLGKYTGKVYEDKTEMEECGVIITDEQSKDEQWCQQHHLTDLLDCVTCGGCPVAQKI